MMNIKGLLSDEIIEIMIKNDICLNDKKWFKEEYLDGRVYEYEMTFADLLYGVGINDAILYWNDIEPFSEEDTYETELRLGLLTEDEYKMLK